MSSAGVARPPAIGRSGAGAWETVPQARQPYLGRQMRITRNFAGTQSSISLTLSPIGCSAPPQAHTVVLTSTRTSSRGRLSGSGLRPDFLFFLFFALAGGSGLASARASSVSRSSSPSAIWSASMRSDRRPNRARRNCLMISWSRSISSSRCSTAEAMSRTRSCSRAVSDGRSLRSNCMTNRMRQAR